MYAFFADLGLVSFDANGKERWRVPLGPFNTFYGLAGFVQLFLYALVLGLCLTYFMTFRGFLFAQLYGTTRRSRIYRYKARTD